MQAGRPMFAYAPGEGAKMNGANVGLFPFWHFRRSAVLPFYLVIRDQRWEKS